MVGKYLWVTLHKHQVMDDLLRKQLHQQQEVDPHIMLYCFEHIAPWVELSALKQRVEAQAKTLDQMENKCTELWDRVDSLKEKVNRLGKK